MRYVALDVQTTGRDPARGQVLEVALCVDDLARPQPLTGLPVLNLFVRHPRYCVEPEAMLLHLDTLRHLCAGAESIHDVRVSEWGKVYDRFRAWFDLQFRKGEDGWREVTFAGHHVWRGLDFLRDPLHLSLVRPHRRSFDVAAHWMRPEDREVPDLDEACRRAGWERAAPHRAGEGVRDVVRLVRAWKGVI